MIEEGVPIVPDATGRTLLNRAIYSLNPNMVVFLLEFNRPTEIGGDAKQALIQALSAGNCPLATKLIETYGLDPNQRDSKGRTLLMIAVAANQLDQVEMLLAHGSDPRLLDDQGKTVQDYLEPAPPEHHENAFESWRHSDVGKIRNLLIDYLVPVAKATGTI